LDFSSLELLLLKKLTIPEEMSEFKSQLKAILVDEYQDTNQLQESIYFQMARIVMANGGGITVVGDDDQSLYRFRGSKVELFADFQKRISSAIPHTAVHVVTLKANYRSTPVIVAFTNHFINSDKEYQHARARFKRGGHAECKPPIESKRHLTDEPLPVFVMLRETRAALAEAMARIVSETFQGTGFKCGDGTKKFVIQKDGREGSLGDAVLLCASPKESENNGLPSLPLQLRRTLQSLEKPIGVFNPRGRDMSIFDQIARLMGLSLQCIDPTGTIQPKVSHTREAHGILDNWRDQAAAFRRSLPRSPKGDNLDTYVRTWPTKKARQVNIAELLHELVAWFPYFQKDPEGLAILEQIMRVVTDSALVAKYEMNIIEHKTPAIAEASRKDAIRHFCLAVADGADDMDEDLLFAPPKDRFSIMSIHQAKGLEFPLTFVDVGARFRTAHAKQRFHRFPDTASTSHILEDLLESPGAGRVGLERAFDDLVRQYYVAFTRTQDVLILVGLDKNLTKDNIHNIATGWDRQARWHWESLAEAYRASTPRAELHWNGESIPFVFI
jgi:DNA helicase-2/ATP-dependent DNA helicase PcrA